MSRSGPLHYRSTPVSTHDFCPGDEVDYHIDRSSVLGFRQSIPAIVVNVTDKRIVIRVKTEDRHRSIRPENLSKRA